MPSADLVIRGTVRTVDDAQPTAEALAVADGRIVAVGNRADVDTWIGPATQTPDLGDGCVMPGLVEAHGHPLMGAIAWLNGEAPDTQERITVEQAIRAQTIDAAWQLFADDVIGWLEVGKYADMVVLSADPRSVPPDIPGDRRPRGARDVSRGQAGLCERQLTHRPSWLGSNHVRPG